MSCADLGFARLLLLFTRGVVIRTGSRGLDGGSTNGATVGVSSLVGGGVVWTTAGVVRGVGCGWRFTLGVVGGVLGGSVFFAFVVVAVGDLGAADSCVDFVFLSDGADAAFVVVVVFGPVALTFGFD